jgi:hypothetical protein
VEDEEEAEGSVDEEEDEDEEERTGTSTMEESLRSRVGMCTALALLLVAPPPEHGSDCGSIAPVCAVTSFGSDATSTVDGTPFRLVSTAAPASVAGVFSESEVGAELRTVLRQGQADYDVRRRALATAAAQGSRKEAHRGRKAGMVLLAASFENGYLYVVDPELERDPSTGKMASQRVSDSVKADAPVVSAVLLSSHPVLAFALEPVPTAHDSAPGCFVGVAGCAAGPVVLFALDLQGPGSAVTGTVPLTAPGISACVPVPGAVSSCFVTGGWDGAIRAFLSAGAGQPLGRSGRATGPEEHGQGAVLASWHEASIFSLSAYAPAASDRSSTEIDFLVNKSGIRNEDASNGGPEHDSAFDLDLVESLDAVSSVMSSDVTPSMATAPNTGLLCSGGKDGRVAIWVLSIDSPV